MKKNKVYVTLPGFTTIPEAAEKMALSLNGTSSQNQINFFYRLIKNEIKMDRIKSEVIGSTGRVKQVKISDVDNIILRYGNNNKDLNNPKIIENNINVDISAIIELKKNGRLSADRAIEIIEKMLC